MSIDKITKELVASFKEKRESEEVSNISKGQYITKQNLLDEGFSFKCTIPHKYELWFSKEQNVIIEEIHEDRCLIYKTFRQGE